MGKLAIGIDLGGTNLKGVLLNEQGELAKIYRIPTEANKGGAQVLQKILYFIDLLIKSKPINEKIVGVGIGTPGFISEDGLVLGGAENLPGWKGTRLYEPIQQRFGLRAVAANDVTVMALAESRFGAGRGVKNLACFALGTGIGGGLVIDGKLYKGTHGMAGEMGHISVEPDGILCNCGNRGCVEQYASATGIANLGKIFASENQNIKKTPFVAEALKDLSKVTSKMVYDFVHKNDPVAVEVHEKACDMMARAVGIVMNVLAPDRVVLGGGVLKAGQVILDTVSKYTHRYCWPSIRQYCDIVIAESGENSGVLGAGAMAFDEFLNK
jgi:glucokinase